MASINQLTKLVLTVSSGRLFQELRIHLPGADQGPVLKTSLWGECAGFEQPRPAELILSCPTGRKEGREGGREEGERERERKKEGRKDRQTDNGREGGDGGRKKEKKRASGVDWELGVNG